MNHLFKRPMRRVASFAATLALSALAVLSPAEGRADYPNQTIRLIAPYAPGGQTDIVARLVADPLSKSLGVPVVVENKPGANGLLGYDHAAKAKPDGYTLLVGNSALLAVTPSVLQSRKINPPGEFAPITVVGTGPLLLEVNPSLPIHSVADLIAYDKANPGKLNFGLGGLGTIHHLIVEKLKLVYGGSWTNVTYKGSGPMLVDLIGGRVQFTIDNISSSVGHVKSGQLRAIAITQKTDLFPDLPALSDIPELAGLEASAWHGILAPANTPPAIVNKVNAALVEIINRPETRERLVALGLVPVANSAEDFRKHIVDEIARWKVVADQSGTRIE